MTWIRGSQQDSMNSRLLALWAADCAEHVLYLFEEKYPDDDRPRKAIEALHKWIRGEMQVGQVRIAASAAHAAARESGDPVATAVARAAGQAAATAHVRGHARHAAQYAIKAIKEADGQAAALTERDRQLRLLVDVDKT
jgi:hypothetical protein